MSNQPERINRKKRPTSIDVARLAGVSQSTVSRVFNDKWTSKLRGDARERVLAAAEKLGYTPNAIAHILNSNHSSIVGIIVSKEFDLFYYEVLNLLTIELECFGYKTLLLTSTPSDDINALLTDMSKYQVDGIIITSAALSHHLRQTRVNAGIPLVLFNGYVPGLPVSAVQSDNYGAGIMMAKYLYSLGRRRFAYVTSEKSIYSNQIERQRGFLDGLLQCGIADCACYPGDYKYKSGAEACEAMLQTSPLPEAIFCAGDYSALGVIDTLRKHGLREGQDVSVAGFEATDITGTPAYSLTALKQNLPLMAADAVRLLLEQIKTPGSPCQVITRPMEILERNSTQRKK